MYLVVIGPPHTSGGIFSQPSGNDKSSIKMGTNETGSLDLGNLFVKM